MKFTLDILFIRINCYAAISNRENRNAIEKKIPTEWGIVSYGNPYGLGFIYQVLREAK